MPIGMGARTIQRIKTRKNGWTVARRATFLDALCQSCNATEAARVTGVNVHSAHSLRRRDGEFAELWDAAIALGERRLREELLALQLRQLPSGDNPMGERDEGPAVPFDPLVAIKVLQLRGGFHGRDPAGAKAATQAEVDAALMARLEALAGRHGERDAEPGNEQGK